MCDKPYDGDAFLTYPTRVSRHDVLPSEGQQPFWWVKHQHPSDDEELESFFQSWIFFGLLHELLSPRGLFNAADYIGTDDNGDFVHTKVLAVKLRAWLGLTGRLGVDDQVKLKLRLMECLKLAYQSMRCLLPSDGDPSRGHPEFNRGIRTSLASIGETISALGDMILNVVPEVDWIMFDLFATYNDSEKAHMRQNGWCPSLIASAEKEFSSVAGHFYLQCVRQPLLGIDHDECTDEGCSKLQIDEKTYSPRHVEESCACSAAGPSLSEVATCLDSETFPVLDIVGNTVDDVSAKGVPYEQSLAYVAFSHVWVDGLGNPAAITLPRCQLLQLRRLVEGLHGCTYKWLECGEERTERRKLYLWCDRATRCCARSKDVHLTA